jgi:dTDP-4-dehydrorhamnose 3,5-epimerase
MDISGVRLIPLHGNPDERGVLTEVFRSEWLSEGRFVQWNAVQSAPNVMRGVHVHREHCDYLVVLEGLTEIWLRDLRKDSVSCDVVEHIELTGVESCAILVPPGVAHGLASLSPSWLLAGESRYWSLDDELRCRWDDPDLGFRWRVDAPTLSAQDQDAGSFADLLRVYRSGTSEPASKGFDGCGEPDTSADSTASR